MEHFLEQIHTFLSCSAYLCLYVLEAIALAIIVFSALRSVLNLFHKNKNTKKPLLRGLSIALTFKLAAEIIRTITVRSLDEIIQIGALILVKAAITFLIHWEWKSANALAEEIEDIE